MVTQSGLFVPLRSRELPLHRYAAVALRYAPGDAEHPVQVGPGPLPAGARAPEWVSQLMRSAKAGLIGVKTQQGVFTFGMGLPDDEVAYLWALVERALGRA